MESVESDRFRHNSYSHWRSIKWVVKIKTLPIFIRFHLCSKGILFHTLYAPSSGVYCEQLSCTLQGKFDIALFQRTWTEAIARHPILRTAFVWEGLKEPYKLYINKSNYLGNNTTGGN
jgi:hypothetical protein